MDFEQMYKDELAKTTALEESLKALQEKIDSGDVLKEAIEAGKVYEAKRFSNQTKKLNDTVEELKQFKESKSTLEEQLKSLNNDLAEVTEKFETVTGERDAVNQSLTEKEREIERFGLLRQFPSLLPLDDEGLLPQADDIDELKEKYSSLAERLENEVESRLAEKLKGAKEPKPSHKSITPDGVKKSVQLKEQAMLSYNKGDYRAYEKLLNESVAQSIIEEAATKA